jgi:hypothetical protein
MSSKTKTTTTMTTHHQMLIEGSLYKEYKEAESTTTADGTEESYRRSHFRGIDQKNYCVIEEKKKDSDLEKRIVTNLKKEELASFEQQWTKNWKPTVKE